MVRVLPGDRPDSLSSSFDRSASNGPIVLDGATGRRRFFNSTVEHKQEQVVPPTAVMRNRMATDASLTPRTEGEPPNPVTGSKLP